MRFLGRRLVRAGFWSFIAIGHSLGCASNLPPGALNGSTQEIVILSDPPGARIVIDRDTLEATTPLTTRRERDALGGIADQIHIRALPVQPGLCRQLLVIPFDQPAPDTVRFRMNRCPSGDQDFARAFEEDEVEDFPERLRGPRPIYPDLLMQAGVQGIVLLQFVVDTTGRPEATSLMVVAASNTGFVSSAKATVLGSTFRPGRILGRKVRTRVRMPVKYTIRY